MFIWGKIQKSCKLTCDRSLSGVPAAVVCSSPPGIHTSVRHQATDTVEVVNQQRLGILHPLLAGNGEVIGLFAFGNYT